MPERTIKYSKHEVQRVFARLLGASTNEVKAGAVEVRTSAEIDETQLAELTADDPNDPY